MDNRLYLQKPIEMRVAIMDGGNVQEIEAKIKELREIANKYNCNIKLDVVITENFKSYIELIRSIKTWI